MTLLVFFAVLFVSFAEAQPPALTAPAAGEELDNGCQDQSNYIEWAFEWAPVPNAKRYQLFVKSPSAPQPVISVSIDRGTRYEHRRRAYIPDRNTAIWTWKVRALVGKQFTEWSEERHFRVEPINTDCD